MITSEEQLQRWVDGESIHREITGVDGGECTPDFSCCMPDLLADKEIRVAFQAASQNDRLKFLGGFLGAAMSKYSKKVHITGVSTPGEES